MYYLGNGKGRLRGNVLGSQFYFVSLTYILRDNYTGGTCQATCRDVAISDGARPYDFYPMVSDRDSFGIDNGCQI